MPRSTVSKAAMILDYFKTTNIEAASQLLDLASAEVRARHQKSTTARQRAQSTVAVPAAVSHDRPASAAKTAVRSHKAKGKATVGRKRGRPRKPQNVPLPLVDDVVAADPTAALPPQ